MSRRILHSHAPIIDELGGPTVIRNYIKDKTGKDRTSQAISMWRVQGIPHWARPTIVQLARERRKKGVIPSGFIVGMAA